MPLLCVNCNAPLVVVDAPSSICRFCGAINVLPEVYREELHLARNLDAATRQAAEQWIRLALLESSSEQAWSDAHRNAPVAGTRGWYDNAFDRVNFIVPAFVTLMFLAIQIMALRTKP